MAVIHNPALEALRSERDAVKLELEALKLRFTRDAVQSALAALGDRQTALENAFRDLVTGHNESVLALVTRLAGCERALFGEFVAAGPDPSDGHGTQASPGPALPAAEPPAGGVPEGEAEGTEGAESDTVTADTEPPPPNDSGA